MTGERLQPNGERQQRMPVEALKPQMDGLIEDFRKKLSQCPEFQRALVHNYLYGEQDSDEVEFRRGDYHYAVYLAGVPEETEEERESSVDRGIGPYTGWKTLTIERSPSTDYRPGYGYDESVEMRIAPSESEYDKTETRYNNFKEEVQEVNTPQALEKAQEIITTF